MKFLISMVLALLCLSLFATADIQVTYIGFSTEQQAAFEYATSIWEPVITSSIPIKIHAVVQTVPGFVVITLPNLIHNFAAAPTQNVWYSTALANALTSTELNAGEADVDFIINPSQPWYYGLDGNCPTGSIDFVSEMTKAIAYGLGYQSSFYVQQGYGSYGMLNPSVLGLSTSFTWEPMQNLPVLYDTFICNSQGQFLTNTALFTNPSPALNAQITGGSLRYHGTYGMQYNADQEPVLYASGFNLARTARLLAATYDGTENAPGVPTAYNGNVMHYIAPIVLGMLQDQGWVISPTSLLATPSALQGNISGSSVLLAWQAPDSPYDIHEYRVYRDDTLLGTTTDLGWMDEDLQPGTSANYYVLAVYTLGPSALSEGVNVQMPSANGDPVQSPAAFLNLSLAPNPFSNTCRIAISQKQAGELRLSVYNLKGRKLGIIHRGLCGSGSTEFVWNGTDGDSRRLPSGVYLLKAESNGRSSVSKALILR